MFAAKEHENFGDLYFIEKLMLHAHVLSTFTVETIHELLRKRTKRREAEKAHPTTNSIWTMHTLHGMTIGDGGGDGSRGDDYNKDNITIAFS